MFKGPIWPSDLSIPEDTDGKQDPLLEVCWRLVKEQLHGD
jgi:hypothetical protein